MLRTFTCQQCNKTFDRQWYPSKEKSRSTFEYCSSDCVSKARRKHKDIPCPICGKVFTRSKGGAMKYCSRQCNTIAQRKQVEKICEYCGKVFSVKASIANRARRNGGMYCSVQCKNIASRKPQAYTICHCVNCNQKFKVSKAQIRLRGGGKYCSNKCRFEYCKGKNSPVWKGGHDPYYGPNWARQSHKARKRDKHTCQVCGFKQEFRQLDVHHIVPLREFDGDWETANQLNNLITLCVSCHNRAECNVISCP